MQPFCYYLPCTIAAAKAPQKNAINHHYQQRRISQKPMRTHKRVGRTHHHANGSNYIEENTKRQKCQHTVGNALLELLGNYGNGVSNQCKVYNNGSGYKNW